MLDKYNEFIQEVNYWQEILPVLYTNNPKIVELAFLKIYVKFEQFFIESFVHYATGGEGENHYQPIRRLAFADATHLEKIVKKIEHEYIDIKRIEQIADAVFVANNPFSQFFNDAQAKPLFTKMTTIRNFLAHESRESKVKYDKLIVQAYNLSAYDEPYLFLSKENFRHYYSFTEILKNFANIIIGRIII